MKKTLTACALVVAFLVPARAQLYWNTNGTNTSWNSSNWGNSATGPFNSPWVSGTNVVFSLASTLTNFTTVIGDITVNANTAVTPNGTVSSKSGGSIVDVADGITFNWGSQNRSTTANKWTKNGGGTWNVGSGGAGDGQVGSFFTLNAGTVVASGQRAFGSSNSILTINSGTIQSSGSSTFANTNVVIGGNFSLTGSGNDNYTGSVFLGSATRTITNSATGLRAFVGTIAGDSGSGLIFSGTGTTVLAGSNTYAGTTTVSGGVLQISNVNALQNSTLNITNGAVAFTLAGSNAYNVGGLAGNVALNISGNALSVGANNANTAYSGRLTNAAGSPGSIVKVGSGTLTLSGNNNYDGATTVGAGALLVNGDQSGALGTVSVATGAKLGGAGKIGGAVSVSGTLAPGSSIESLATGALSFNNGSTFAVELDSSVATSLGADLVVANGNFSLESPGTITLTLTDLALSPVALVEGTKFSLINYSGSWNNGLFTYGAGALADGDFFTFGLNTWKIDYNATSGGANFTSDQIAGNFVNIEAVPEPSTYALLALSGIGFAGYVVRRRRR